MSDETIFATLPEITEETTRLAELQLAHYIWYEGNGARHRREYHCSCCHETWRHDELVLVTPEDNYLYISDHGAEVVCPRCGETARLMCWQSAFGLPVQPGVRCIGIGGDAGKCERGMDQNFPHGARLRQLFRQRLRCTLRGTAGVAGDVAASAGAG